MHTAIRKAVMEAWEKNGGEVEEWKWWKGCVVAIKSGQAAEVELTAFVTWGLSLACGSATPTNRALCINTQRWLCVSEWLCVCVCVPQACPSDRLWSLSAFLLPLFLPPSLARFCLSCSLHLLHPSVSPSFFKGGPSLPATPSSQHPLNLSVCSSVYLPNQSVHLYSGIITNPRRLPPFFFLPFAFC